MTNPTDPLRHIAISRLAAMHAMPYFATPLRSMVPRPFPGVGTVGVTENWILGYDPETILKWTVKELAGALIHEVNHLIRGHAKRRKRMNADAPLWNQAADCEINDDIRAAGLQLPILDESDQKHGGICYPDVWDLPDGKTAEWYYNELQQKQKEQPGQPEGGDGDEDEDGQPKPGDGPEKPGCGTGWCGSGAGRAIPGEPKDAQGGRGEAEGERIRRETAAAIKKHVKNKGRGTVGGSLEEWAEEILGPPQIRWEDKLRSSMRGALHWAAGKVDMRYDGMGRRQGAVGYGVGVVMMPRLRKPVPKVTVIRDTSGSMGIDEEIALCNAEIDGLCKAAGAEIELIDIDTEVKAKRRIRSGADARMATGRHGTDMCPAFEELNERGAAQRPHIVILMTDGHTPVPELPGTYRTICCLMGEHAGRPYKRESSTPCNEGDWFHAEIPVTPGGMVTAA